MAAGLTWGQVAGWRMRRQFLTGVDGGSAADVVRRLAGVQAQVATSAALAVAVRQAEPDLQATAKALAGGTLLRTWAMRGTLHLLNPDVAPSFLSLIAAARTWHKGSWQKTFVTLDQVEAMSVAVTAALAGGRALTRDELVDHVLAETGDGHLAGELRSGWGAVLKPLAWQGLLINGPGEDGVTFVSPAAHVDGWELPAPDDAAPTVIEAYLGAYGPASPATFDAWLLRGATPRATLRRWFADLLADGRLVTVEVEGEPLFARAGDVAGLEAERPAGVLRMVGGFDQAVLGPGTAEGHVVPAEHRSSVSLKAGWIAPVILVDGQAVGTWTARDGRVETLPFGSFPARTAKQLATEIARISPLLRH